MLCLAVFLVLWSQFTNNVNNNKTSASNGTCISRLESSLCEDGSVTIH